MKTLFSFMIEKDVLKKIKKIENKTVAEFAREAIDYYLEYKPNFYLNIHKSIETILYELQHGLPLSIDDYHELFAKLDSFYACNKDVTCLSNEETVLLAFCAAELLQLEFYKPDISQHPERYFADYFISDPSLTNILGRVNFVGLVTFLHFELGKTKFHTLSLIRIIEVFIRDKLTLSLECQAHIYLKKIHSILIKLTVHLLIEDKNKNFSGFSNLLNIKENKEKTPVKISKEERDKYEFVYSDDNFHFHGSLYIIDGTPGRFYIETKNEHTGYATMSLAQWTEVIAFLRDPYYQPSSFLFVKSRNDFMMEWRYPFMVGDLDKFKSFVFKLIELDEYKKLMAYIYNLEDIDEHLN